jgi:hypothetical protein
MTCEKCGYPWATLPKCPNCKRYPRNVELSPQQKKAGTNSIVLFIIGLIVFSILKAMDISSGFIDFLLAALFFIMIFNIVSAGKKS